MWAKEIILFYCFILLTSCTCAQENPFRVGLQAGLPLIGANVEYVLSSLNGRLGLKAELETGVAKYPWESLLVGTSRTDDITAVSVGVSFYPLGKGKSIYLNANYVRISGTLGYFEFDEEFENEYNGAYSYTKNDVSLKIGAVWGKRLYIRPQVGLFIDPFPKTKQVEIILRDTNGATRTGTVSTEFEAEEKLIISLGIGYAF